MSSIDIRTPFDDDSHTLQDGALQRFFRMRKWMFATGVLLIMLDAGWLDFAAATAALNMASLPKIAVHFALSIAGAYLLLQALVIFTQIIGTYLHSLDVRSELFKMPGETEWYRQFESASAEKRALESERDRYPAVDARRADMDRRIERYVVQIDTLTALRLRIERRFAPFKTVTMVGEIILDAMRLVPMPIFLAYAVLAHGTWAAPDMSRLL